VNSASYKKVYFDIFINFWPFPEESDYFPIYYKMKVCFYKLTYIQNCSPMILRRFRLCLINALNSCMKLLPNFIRLLDVQLFIPTYHYLLTSVLEIYENFICVYMNWNCDRVLIKMRWFLTVYALIIHICVINPVRNGIDFIFTYTVSILIRTRILPIFLLKTVSMHI
jgi:hypothetical protein